MTSIDDIIQKIASLQDSASPHYFSDGLFESYRGNAIWGYKRPDTNLFFTAITLFTLQSIQSKLSLNSRQIINTICQKGIQNYPDFQNKDGLLTFNFFKTKPSQHFPHGNILHRFEHFRIPDDIDDTAFVYLTANYTPKDAIALQAKLRVHSNGYKQSIRNTFPAYRSLKAYSTWFGKNMYIEFDACALSNMLYCLLHFGIELDEHGIDSVRYIQQCILSNHYLTTPFRVAHQYARTPLIIYHVVRLIARFKLPELEICQEKIIQDIQHLLTTSSLSLMDRMILETSLFRLQVPYQSALSLEQLSHSEEIRNYSFFIAGFLTAYENPLLYRIASSPLFHIQWSCEAHSWALLAEWLTLKNEANLNV